jgi:hypothetical protein
MVTFSHISAATPYGAVFVQTKGLFMLGRASRLSLVGRTAPGVPFCWPPEHKVTGGSLTAFAPALPNHELS